jgi:hypothetical protein
MACSIALLWLACLFALSGGIHAAHKSPPEDWVSRSIMQVLTDRFALADCPTNPPRCKDLMNACGGNHIGLRQRLDYVQVGAPACLTPSGRQVHQLTASAPGRCREWVLTQSGLVLSHRKLAAPFLSSKMVGTVRPAALAFLFQVPKHQVLTVGMFSACCPSKLVRLLAQGELSVNDEPSVLSATLP